jgi:hypothetical protein
LVASSMHSGKSAEDEAQLKEIFGISCSWYSPSLVGAIADCGAIGRANPIDLDQHGCHAPCDH